MLRILSLLLLQFSCLTYALAAKNGDAEVAVAPGGSPHHSNHFSSSHSSRSSSPHSSRHSSPKPLAKKEEEKEDDSVGHSVFDSVLGGHSAPGSNPVSPRKSGSEGHSASVSGPTDHSTSVSGPADLSASLSGPADHSASVSDTADHSASVSDPADHSASVSGPVSPRHSVSGDSSPHRPRSLAHSRPNFAPGSLVLDSLTTKDLAASLNIDEGTKTPNSTPMQSPRSPSAFPHPLPAAPHPTPRVDGASSSSSDSLPEHFSSPVSDPAAIDSPTKAFFAEMDVQKPDIEEIKQFVQIASSLLSKFYRILPKKTEENRGRVIQAMRVEIGPGLIEPMMERITAKSVGAGLWLMFTELTDRCFHYFLPKNTGTQSERGLARQFCLGGTILVMADKLAERWQEHEEEEEKKKSEEKIPFLEEGKSYSEEHEISEVVDPTESESKSGEQYASGDKAAFGGDDQCDPASCQQQLGTAAPRPGLRARLAAFLRCCYAICVRLLCPVHLWRALMGRPRMIGASGNSAMAASAEDEEMDDEMDMDDPDQIRSLLEMAIRDWELTKKMVVETKAVENEQLVDTLNSLDKGKLGEFIGKHIQIMEEEEEEKDVPEMDKVD